MERKTPIYDVCVRPASVLFRVDSVAVCGNRRRLLETQFTKVLTILNARNFQDTGIVLPGKLI
jgi:hypothetical protein